MRLEWGGGGIETSQIMRNYFITCFNNNSKYYYCIAYPIKFIDTINAT